MVVVYAMKTYLPRYLEHWIQVGCLSTTHQCYQPTELIITQFAGSVSIVLVEERLNFLIAEDTSKFSESLRKLFDIDSALVGGIKILKGLSHCLSFIIFG